MSGNEMRHSQEPWELREVDGLFAIACADGFVFEGSDDQSRVDWHRAILCVNTLAPVPTEELEKAGTGLMSDAAVCVGKLTKQRDELLSVLNLIVGISCEIDTIERCESWEGGSPEYGTVITFGKIKQKIEKARAVISKIEAGI